MKQNNEQSCKRWFIYCEPCSHRQIITDDPSTAGLHEIKTAPIPGGSPKLGTDGKTKTKKAIDQPRKFKCPKCGRGVTCKRLPDVYVNAFKNIDAEQRRAAEEEEKRKRIEDGTPTKRPKTTTPEFLG